MWSFVQIGQELILKDLSRSQHRPIKCRRTSLICAEFAGCRTWPRQFHNKAICEFVRIGQELNELSRSQHRPIRCRRTLLICTEIAGCRTWPRQCHNKAICEVSSKSVKNWSSYRVHNVTVTDGRTQPKTISPTFAPTGYKNRPLICTGYPVHIRSSLERICTGYPVPIQHEMFFFCITEHLCHSFPVSVICISSVTLL
jgi:hypothetical protein